MTGTGDETTRLTPVVADSAPRVQLVASPGSKAETVIKCRRIVTLLGSRDGCKVKLPHRRVCAVHVAIVNNGSEVLAVDLVTPHGTLLNELKLEHERLQSGDVLKVGPWQLQVDIQPPDQEGEDVHPFGLEPAPKVIALEHVTTRRILQPTRDICIIGRRQGCDISISDTGVSRTHAILFTYFGFPAIFDLLSRNRTVVNDAPTSFKLLQNDDEVTIGESRFRVRLLGSPVSEHAVSQLDAAGKPQQPTPQAPAPDLIDIKATEGSQRWRVAENLEKANRKR